MDNLTHTLAGALLAQTRLREWAPYATTTLVIGANLPDADILSRLTGGKAAYLQYHRGVSHALLGVVLLAIGLALAIWVANRLRSAATRRKAPFMRLLAVSLLGLATHPLLDFTNSYGIRPFLPVSGEWLYGDLVFIVDPLLWLLLGGPLFLLTRRTPGRNVTWAGTALVLSFAILLTPLFGTGIKVVWVLTLAVLIVLRRRVTRLPQGLALTALIAVVTYWGLRGLGHEMAAARLNRYVLETFGPQAEVRTAVLPAATSPFLWRAIIETDTAVFTSNGFSMLGDLEELKEYRRAQGMDDPYVQAALATHAGEVMRAFARFPIVRVINRGDQVEVTLSDARFAQGDDMGWCALTVNLPERLSSSGSVR